MGWEVGEGTARPVGTGRPGRRCILLLLLATTTLPAPFQLAAMIIVAPITSNGKPHNYPPSPPTPRTHPPTQPQAPLDCHPKPNS